VVVLRKEEMGPGETKGSLVNVHAAEFSLGCKIAFNKA